MPLNTLHMKKTEGGEAKMSAPSTPLVDFYKAVHAVRTQCLAATSEGEKSNTCPCLVAWVQVSGAGRPQRALFFKWSNTR